MLNAYEAMKNSGESILDDGAFTKTGFDFEKSKRLTNYVEEHRPWTEFDEKLFR